MFPILLRRYLQINTIHSLASERRRHNLNRSASMWLVWHSYLRFAFYAVCTNSIWEPHWKIQLYEMKWMYTARMRKREREESKKCSAFFSNRLWMFEKSLSVSFIQWQLIWRRTDVRYWITFSRFNSKTFEI